jgi:hypothetical protein
MGELTELLTLHAALEERYFYPLLRKHGFGDLADHAVAEHAETRHLIARMLATKKNSPELEDTFLSLDHYMRKHFEEEEKDLFPRIREFTEELDEAGRQMADALGRVGDQELLAIAEHEELPTV